jgi:hypothetical protein
MFRMLLAWEPFVLADAVPKSFRRLRPRSWSKGPRLERTNSLDRPRRLGFFLPLHDVTF